MEKTSSTFVVTYEDGSNDIVAPVSWKTLDQVERLQYEILQAAHEVNFSLGNLFKASNKRFWSNAKKLAALLPVDGNEKPGFDPEKIDSMDELCRIFVSTTTGRMNLTGSVWGEGETLEPSEICRIHHLNFIQLLIQIESQEKTVTPKSSTTTRKATPVKSAS
jgi:hypothetical protein